MEEREQRWNKLKDQIKCPLNPDLCRKTEGIKLSEQFLSHSAIVITGECNFCGKRASEWGQR